jgi:hypothetical protein
MNRSLTYVFGPEVVLLAFTGLTFWLCSRYPSGEGRDVLIMEKCVMLLPFVMVPPVFATVFVPGAKNWWWLGRAIILTYAVMCICAGKFIGGFGTGAKGQDAGFIMVIGFGTVFIAIGAAIAGAMILAEARPAFGAWFKAHRVIGSILTLFAAVPIGFALGVTAMVGIGIFAGAYSSFRR